MGTKQQSISSYAGLGGILIVTFLLVGLIGFMANPPTPSESSGSSVNPAIAWQVDEPDEETEEYLLPVMAWFDAHESKRERVTSQNAYDNYMLIRDDTETLVVKVPTAFSDIDMGKWQVDDETVGFFLTAAADLERFEAGEAEAGVWMGVYAPSDEHQHQHEDEYKDEHQHRSLTAQEKAEFEKVLADELAKLLDECKTEGRYAYLNPFYKGNYDFYVECGQTEHHQLVVTTSPPNSPYIIVLRINLLSQADIDLAAHILDSYQVIGTPGYDGHEH